MVREQLIYDANTEDVYWWSYLWARAKNRYQDLLKVG